MQNSKALLFFISLLVSFFFIGCNNPKQSESLIDNPDQLDTIIKEPQILYGFNVDSFKIVGDKVKKNQFFSHQIIKRALKKLQNYYLQIRLRLKTLLVLILM